MHLSYKYTCIHSVHTCVHMRACMYVCVSVCVCVCVCMCVRVHACMRACMGACVCMCVRVRACACMYVCVRECVRVCVCMCVCVCRGRPVTICSACGRFGLDLKLKSPIALDSARLPVKDINKTHLLTKLHTCTCISQRWSKSILRFSDMFVQATCLFCDTVDLKSQKPSNDYVAIIRSKEDAICITFFVTTGVHTYSDRFLA